MHALIPPPIVFLSCGLLMWLIHRYGPRLPFEIPFTVMIFWIILAAGLFVMMAGVNRIFKHRTVIHPNRKSLPEATHLVTDGIFRYTRNPIYLGMAIMLVAWTIRLGNVWAVGGVVIFVGFIHVFQIKPEEEALEEVFGQAYRTYKTRVRRWI